MKQNTYIITFDNGSVADANRWASELKEVFLDATSDIEVEQRRDNPYSQDFGATLVLILGTPAIIRDSRYCGFLLRSKNATRRTKSEREKVSIEQTR